METKICSDLDCEAEHEDQPLDNFHVNISGILGRTSKCKVCVLRIKKDLYRSGHLKTSSQTKEKRPLPTASSIMIKASIDNEEEKITPCNIKKIIESMKLEDNSQDCKHYIKFYIDDCRNVIKKLKSLLQVPL